MKKRSICGSAGNRKIFTFTNHSIHDNHSESAGRVSSNSWLTLLSARLISSVFVHSCNVKAVIRTERSSKKNTKKQTNRTRQHVLVLVCPSDRTPSDCFCRTLEKHNVLNTLLARLTVIIFSFLKAKIKQHLNSWFVHNRPLPSLFFKSDLKWPQNRLLSDFWETSVWNKRRAGYKTFNIIQYLINSDKGGAGPILGGPVLAGSDTN